MSSRRFDGWTDAGLVEAAHDGDRDAFAELIVRHRGTALAVSGRLLGSMDLAGDAVQEASLLAMTSLDRLRSPAVRCLAVRDRAECGPAMAA